MRRPSPFAAAAVALAGLLATVAALPAAADVPAGAPIAGGPTTRLLVRVEDGADAAPVHRAAGAGRVVRLARVGIDVVELPAAEAGRAMAAYRAHPAVAVVEPDAPVHAAAAPNDPLYVQQWNLQPASDLNRGTANWEAVAGGVNGTGVTVAVIDSGFRRGGEDEPAHLVMGHDFVDDDEDPTDENGHGTHITGTIAQGTGNGKGVAGVAPGATVLVLRALDAEGDGTVSDVVQAMDHALVRGARVLNLSLAGNFSSALCDAVARASTQAAIVAAAGNLTSPFDDGSVSYPARCPGAIGVSALTYEGTLAPYSHRGPGIDLAAPGGQMAETCDVDTRAVLQEMFVEDAFHYVCRQGTSMAAAHVAGAAALVLQVNAFANVESALKLSARDLGPPGADELFGAGALDVARAIGVAPTVSGRGYWMVASDGGVFSFGDAPFYGSTGAVRLNRPIVGMGTTPNSRGYWMVASDGGIFSFGDARFFGSTGGVALNQPIVGMAATPTGRGYWLVASDGGIFSFGDAAFYGSTGAIRLNQPIVGIAATPTGRGYWMVASDGGIFSFGDAAFHGSTGGVALTRPVVSIVPTGTGRGYWMVASDGGIFSFGDARFHGSTGGIALNQPIVAMAATPTSRGYWMVASDGGIFSFGDAVFLGSTGGIRLNQPIVGMARFA